MESKTDKSAFSEISKILGYLIDESNNELESWKGKNRNPKFPHGILFR